MKGTFLDPNQEVESWKDAYYDKFKKIPAADLANYLEKEANQILEQNNIKCVASKIVKKPQLAKI